MFVSRRISCWHLTRWSSCVIATAITLENKMRAGEMDVAVVGAMESPRPAKRRRVSTDSIELPTPPETETEQPLGPSGVEFIDEKAAVGSVASTVESDGQQLATPPTEDQKVARQRPGEAKQGDAADDALDFATHVLATEAAALNNAVALYRTSASARKCLGHAVCTIAGSQQKHGKLITCGVGKSAYIAQKLAATCKSLGIRATFLHACEAMHGDLGDVRDDDVVLFVSYSGKTPELMNLLPHVPEATQMIALTSHVRATDCPLLANKADGILLPAPIIDKEEVSFGVSAPTTSTTVALAVGDMLALSVAERMHGERKGDVFKRNHPGGAIGINEREAATRKRRGDEVVLLELPSPSISGSDDG